MKIAAQEAGKSRRARHSEQMILFAIANRCSRLRPIRCRKFAARIVWLARQMKSTIREFPKVRHTLERSHQTYYVVNAGAHFGLPVTRPTLVLILRQLRVAVLVDRIERMAEVTAVHSLPRAFEGDERRWYRGLTYVDDHVIPVIQPSGFLTAEEFQRLDLATSAGAASHELEGAVRT